MTTVTGRLVAQGTVQMVFVLSPHLLNELSESHSRYAKKKPSKTMLSVRLLYYCYRQQLSAGSSGLR